MQSIRRKLDNNGLHVRTSCGMPLKKNTKRHLIMLKWIWIYLWSSGRMFYGVMWAFWTHRSVSGAKKAKLMSRRTSSPWSNMEVDLSCYGGAFCCRKWKSWLYEGHHRFFEVSSRFGKDCDVFGAETEAWWPMVLHPWVVLMYVLFFTQVSLLSHFHFPSHVPLAHITHLVPVFLCRHWPALQSDWCPQVDATLQNFIQLFIL